MKRYLTPQVKQDLQNKMVFIGGPRQVGKTTLAKSLLKSKMGYLNWDFTQHREFILKGELPLSKLIVFDEIHKFKSWRNYIKGLYDVKNKNQQYLITGSARLDYYRFGGDSLQGRYHYLRLHPLSAAELKIKSSSDLTSLLTLGGFPEPFLRGSKEEAKRWSREHRSRLINEDLVNLEIIHDVGNLELLALRLPELVGNPLSINSLTAEIQTSHKTLSRWLDILERMYAIFRLSPFGAPRIRAVKKEQKHYHFDWSIVPSESLRFENMVAAHLLKWIHFEIDSKGRDLELRYFRDIDGREVDFIVVENKKPIQFVECKWNDREINPALNYLKNKFPKCEAWQISMTGKKDYLTPTGIRVSPAITYLNRLV